MSRHVAKRGRGDCGCAALAQYLRAPRGADPYPIVLQQAAIVDRRWHGLGGLLQRDLIDIARRLDVTLVPRRVYDLETDEGVLGLDWARDRRGHYVAVRGGQIVCSVEGIWDPEDYARHVGAQFLTLLHGTVTDETRVALLARMPE